jgi:hypothetical protein
MTGRSSKAKGYSGENAVVKWLREVGGFPYAERRRAGASKDTGDIVGVIPGLCIEVKNHARMALSDWVDQLIEEMGNHSIPAWSGAVIHKRRGKTDVGEWYATMPAHVWLDLIKEVDGRG